MTTSKKKSIRAPSVELELDLDSLLLSHGGHLSSSSDEDGNGDLASFPHRSVDEILNDTDSSSEDDNFSSSPRPPILDQIPPSGSSPPPRNLENGNDQEDQAPSSSFTWRRSRSRELLSVSSLPSLGFRPPSTSSRLLPPLFGSVKPSPKPGAALAAAAAASRLIPTRHAMAIKNRRASSSGEMQRAESSEDSQEQQEQDLSDVIAVPPPMAAVSSDEKLEIYAAVSRSSSSSVEDDAVVPKEPKEDVLIKELEPSDLVEAKEDNLVDLSRLASAPSVVNNEKDGGTSVAEGVGISVTQQDDILPLQGAGTPVAEHADGTGNQQVDPELVMVEIDTDSCEKSYYDEDLREEIDTGDEMDIVEESLVQLESSERDEKKVEEELQASMKPLELAEELEKRQASYGQHWEEGAAAQPMRLEGIRRGPPAVGYLQLDLDNAVTRTISSQTFRRDCGSPEVVAVHMNSIALGTSKGVVLVFPSKYSPQTADHMDGKMLTFVSHGVKPHTPVTSMCFNQLGDLLLVGFADGSLTFWDVQRATITKMISGEHSAPVVHALCMGQFKFVTADSKGKGQLHTISRSLLNPFSVRSQCFLDGQKNGIVLSASALLMDDLHGIAYNSAQGNPAVSASGLGPLGSIMGGVVGGIVGGEAGWKRFNEGSSSVEEDVVVFVTLHDIVVVKLPPNIGFYDRISKPKGARDGSMPYTAWRCTTHLEDPSIDASERAAWLLIAWDREVQVKQFIKSKLKPYREWSLDSTAIGVAWLDSQMLVVLTLRGQLCLFAKDGTELNRTSFVVDGSGLDDIISYHAHFNNSFGNPEKAYHNAVAVRGATLYILGPMHLLISRLLPWKERIQVLQRAGDWMGALDMAMRLYDGHAQGVIDLPRTVDAIRDAIMPYLVELLLSYVDEVFSYISIAFRNQVNKLGQLESLDSTDSSVRSEIEEQYARAGGVAVEFCVHIKRTDILFDCIFSKFVAVKHEGTFLEILEPYILRDMLGCLPPEIMQALVEHYSVKGWLQRVEQCVLHMDISSLDFNQVVKLCREHGLYGALIYLFNRGLDDFTSPLEELLVVIQNSPSTDVATIGYRMLVYLKYCFQGEAFPPGHGSLSHSRLPSIRKELLQFLLEGSKSVSSNILKRFEPRHENCPNLCYLLWLDTEATLDALRHAFLREEHKVSDVSSSSLTDSTMEPGKEHIESIVNHKLMVQQTVDVLISFLDLESDMISSFVMNDSAQVWPSKKDVVHLLEFISFLVTCNGATISGGVLKHIIEYLTSHNLTKSVDFEKEEKQVLCLLKAVPQTEWDTSNFLHLCSQAHFYQACGFIHTVNGQYIFALDSYMNDLDDPVRVFAFINDMLLQLKDMEASSFRSAVLSRIPEMVKLSRECTYFLVIDHFSSESENILSNLQIHQESLFLFLKTAIDVHLYGTLKFDVLDRAPVSDTQIRSAGDPSKELEDYFKRFSNFPKLLPHHMIQITDEIAELYLELLCKYERYSVLEFLETFENYRLEHCLQVCLDNGVTDAAAFLMERAGDVGSALKLVMGDLTDKIAMLVAAVENKFSETASSIYDETDQLTNILKMTEVICVYDVLHASIGLCQRNTGRLDHQESETLWFELLERFSKQLKGFYRSMELPVRTSSATSGTQLKFTKSANLLRSLFAKFVGEIIEGMVGYIPLPAIMEKLLSDNGNQEFGDFKLTILKMLGTYGYEKKILDTAKSLIEDDTFHTVGMLKKGAMHAFAPHDWTCCICGCSLSKVSNAFRIRVYNCGHSTHLQCESGENEPSNGSSSMGCPICLPKMNSHATNKLIQIESGLVEASKSRSRTNYGTLSVQQGHESDFEKPYGLQQMSRYEILSRLQKSPESIRVDALPPLRLSPPPTYHDKVQLNRAGPAIGETINNVGKNENVNRSWQERKSKGSFNKFPMRTSIFGTGKNRAR